MPVVIDANVWRVLERGVASNTDPQKNPRVFRLFMRRGSPRRVIEATEIGRVSRDERGTIRWKEGEYPLKSGTFRKGGNAFIRGDVNLRLSDAWWMGREQTDLRLLLAKAGEKIQIAAWWSRGGTGGSPANTKQTGTRGLSGF